MEQTPPLLAYNTWLELPRDTRTKLVTLFQIPRTGQSIVNTGMLPNGTIGGIVQQDGHTPTDLYAITVEKMQTALNNPDEKDFHVLWNGVVDNLHLIMPDIQMEPEPEPAPTPEPAPPTDTFIPRPYEDLIKDEPKEEVKPEPAEEITTPNEPKDAKVKKPHAAKSK